MDLKPIPAFYCCYLLRSTIRHASLYVGSTPNPARRLAQHNGMTKGGAARTSRNSLRPWEMACIVTGFPSNIAALQFEWAWQNTHLTRRIADEERVTTRTTRTKVDSRTGKVRKAPGRPRMNLTDKLSNLHLLLRAPSFARLPLEVSFFAQDVHKVWMQWCSNAGDGLHGVKVVLDLATVAASSTGERTLIGGLAGIDPTYAPLKEHFDKSSFLLADGEVVDCAVCATKVDPRGTTLVCSSVGCRAASHMVCLAKHFLENGPDQTPVPRTGRCPVCLSDLQWVDIVKEMTVRIRGDKEIAQLTKKRRPRRRKQALSTSTKASALNTEAVEAEDEDDELSDPSDLDEDLDAVDVIDEPLRHEVDDEDALSVTSIGSHVPERCGSPQRGLTPDQRLEMVIEDSDWEAVEVLD